MKRASINVIYKAPLHHRGQMIAIKITFYLFYSKSCICFKNIYFHIKVKKDKVAPVLN
jgi:hypothetical protein